MITWIQVCATKKEEEEFREDGGVYKKKVDVCGTLSDRIWTLVGGVYHVTPTKTLTFQSFTTVWLVRWILEVDSFSFATFTLFFHI